MAFIDDEESEAQALIDIATSTPLPLPGISSLQPQIPPRAPSLPDGASQMFLLTSKHLSWR